MGRARREGSRAGDAARRRGDPRARRDRRRRGHRREHGLAARVRAWRSVLRGAVPSRATWPHACALSSLSTVTLRYFGSSCASKPKLGSFAGRFIGGAFRPGKKTTVHRPLPLPHNVSEVKISRERKADRRLGTFPLNPESSSQKSFFIGSRHVVFSSSAPCRLFFVTVTHRVAPIATAHAPDLGPTPPGGRVCRGTSLRPFRARSRAFRRRIEPTDTPRASRKASIFNRYV